VALGKGTIAKHNILSGGGVMGSSEMISEVSSFIDGLRAQGAVRTADRLQNALNVVCDRISKESPPSEEEIAIMLFREFFPRTPLAEHLLSRIAAVSRELAKQETGGRRRDSRS
jgi:hypothetical protein